MDLDPTVTLHPPAGSAVVCAIRSADGDDVHLIAASIPLAEIRERVLLEDGSNAHAAGARIEAECRAQPSDSDPERPSWRDLPIEVRAHLEGYQELRFEYRLAEGTMPTRSMQPVALRPGG